jgi:hypothetical protein
VSTGNPTFNTFLAQQLATVSSAYPIGTMDSSQNPQLPSLTPTNFQFQVLTTPSKVVLLQLYIVTNGTAQPQLSLHDVPEPVPAGYDCSLLISSRILFRDVLPASFKKSIFVMTGVDPKDPHKPWTATSSPASIPVPLVNLGDELRANSPVTVSLAGLNISAGTQRPTYPLGLTQSSSFRVPFQNRYCEARYKTMCLSFAWADRSVDVTTQINTTLPIAITGSGEDQQPGAGIRGQRAGRLRHCQRPVQRRQLAGGHRRFLSRRRATGHQGGRRRVISRDLVPGAQEPAVPGRKHGQHVHEPMRPATWSFSATSCHLPDRDGDRGGRSARIGPRLSFHLGPAARRLDTARRDPAQNPRISAGALSPVSAIFDAVVERISAGHDLTGIVSEAQRARMLRAMFDAYYAEFAHPVIFDTCRSWTARLPTLVRLFPTAKLICCVRDVAWIMDSIERQFRSSGFEYTALFKSEAERSSVGWRRWPTPTAWWAIPGMRCARPVFQISPSG